jgi:hypothetical protein
MNIIFSILGIVEFLLLKDESDLFHIVLLDCQILLIGLKFYTISNSVCEFYSNTGENQVTFFYKQMTSFEFLKALKFSLAPSMSIDIKEYMELRRAVRFNLAKNYIEWVKSNKTWLVGFFASSMVPCLFLILLELISKIIAHWNDIVLYVLEIWGELQNLLATWLL